MRTELRNRPLLVLALGLIVGLTLREYPLNFVFALILLLVPGRSLFVASGFLVGLLLSPVVPSQGLMQDQRVDQDAVVASIPRLTPGSADFSRRITCEVEASGHRLELSCDSRFDVSLGDRVHLIGLAKPLREGSESYYLTKGVIGRIRPTSLTVIERGPNVYRWALAVRERFLAFTHSNLPEESAAVVDALCFNVTGGLDPELRDQLRETGTIHIVSASGLHVFVIAFALDGLLGLFPIPRALRIAVLGLLLGFYACAAGLHPAIVRSVAMSMIGLTAYLWRREADLLSSMALAGVTYLLFSPLSVYDPGFQFSFIAVSAFGLFGHWGEPVAGFSRLGDTLRSGLIAFVATFPLVAFYFGFVSISAIPANLLIAPIVMVAVVLSMGSFGLSFLWPDGGGFVMAHAVDPLIGLTKGVLGWFGNMSATLQTPEAFSGYFVVAFYLLALGLVRQRVRPA